ncbi:hypothetical protein [Paraburkholderia fynbosensis]|uniref:Uncharacterized protein n=1 Tax=Paraburkholderia fynbosensis TaxID=1200993 RepID=A0A6J5GZE4_9BURK|nr:hypothetical protein [Paraburkholderia fynbosensis]CAB3809815.1 hypothetical protein LMG27177_06922 [Paraburkholderia fynbosensis]
MEREYRLELGRDDFVKALRLLCTKDERDDGYLCFSFEDGRLTLTRMFNGSPRRVDVSVIIPATGWWPLAADSLWPDVAKYRRMRRHDDEFEDSFFVRFADQRLPIREMPIAFGRVVRGQIAMDFSAARAAGLREMVHG